MNSFCRFLFFAVPLVLSAENRIFNGSFEVGAEGFVLERILRPDTNADLTFTDPVPEKDPSGNTVLRIDNPFAEKTTLHVREVPVPRGKKQVLRFSAKVEKNMNLFVSARVQYAKGSPIWNRTFRIGPQWKTFELPFSVRPKEDGFCSIAFRNDCEPAALFLDNLSLASEGDSTESADPELAFRLDRSCYVKFKGLNPRFHVFFVFSRFLNSFLSFEDKNPPSAISCSPFYVKLFLLYFSIKKSDTVIGGGLIIIRSPTRMGPQLVGVGLLCV